MSQFILENHLSTSRFQLPIILVTNVPIYTGKKSPQYAMNKLYERPKFTLAERYGQAMTVIYTYVVLFSAAPVLIPAAALYALLAYWSDKALILLYCRYPALYDHKLAVQFLKFAPLACLCHFAFASWVFSQWDVPSYFVTGFKGWDEDLVSQHDSDFNEIGRAHV